MLDAALVYQTAKLDISSLLGKSSPSPPPRSSHPPLHRSISVPASNSHVQPASSPSTSPASHVSTSTAPPSILHNAPQQAQFAPLRPPRSTIPTITQAQSIPSGKRPPPAATHPSASPAKKQNSKWSLDEDELIIQLRGKNMKWDDVSKRLPGRTAIACRLHFQNYLERKPVWNEEMKDKLARLYDRMKGTMWGDLAQELGVPWRSAEAMHWMLGNADMSRRANAVPFTMTPTSYSSQPTIPSPSFAPAFEPGLGPPDPLERHSSNFLSGAGRSYDPGLETGITAADEEIEAGERRRRRRPVPETLALQGQQLAPVGHRAKQSGAVALPSLAEIESGITAHAEAEGEQRQVWGREVESQGRLHRRQPSRGTAQPERVMTKPRGVERQETAVKVKRESQESDGDE
ncbi:MAG: hypothetical protein Q9191_008063 [Dirinaria sp. TL-2023a]